MPVQLRLGRVKRSAMGTLVRANARVLRRWDAYVRNPVRGEPQLTRYLEACALRERLALAAGVDLSIWHGRP